MAEQLMGSSWKFISGWLCHLKYTIGGVWAQDRCKTSQDARRQTQSREAPNVWWYRGKLLTAGLIGLVFEQSKGVWSVCTIVRFEVRDPRRKVPKCHRQTMMPLAQLNHRPKQQLITSDHLPTSENDGTMFYCRAQLSKANIGSLDFRWF